MIPSNLTEDEKKVLRITLLTVGLTTLVSGLISWGIDELRDLIHPEKDDEEPKEKPKEKP